MGSEMCIRDRCGEQDWAGVAALVLDARAPVAISAAAVEALGRCCLLYTSDAADERSSVDLGGRRIIKKKKLLQHTAAD